MAEPVPSASTAAENADDEISQTLPANAEDRKAAAALNALNANEMSQDSGGASKPRSAADQEALDKAMSRLEIASGVSKKKDDGKKKTEEELKKDEVVKKKVKISSEDVSWLVDELDLSKVKATDLLRTHDGDAVKAIKAFISPPIKA